MSQCRRCRRPLYEDHMVDSDPLSYCLVNGDATCMLRERCMTLEAVVRTLLDAMVESNEYVPPETQAVMRTARVVLCDDVHRPSKFCNCERCVACRSQPGSTGVSRQDTGGARSSR